MSIFWSLVYKTVPRENHEDTLLQEIMLRRLKEEGTEYKHACSAERKNDASSTPEGFVAFLNRQFPDSPVQFILVDKREITEEEYLMQRADKERRAQRNAEIFRDHLKKG